MGEKEVYADLDVEWVQLIKEARDLGIAKEEIRSFLSCHNAEKTPIE